MKKANRRLPVERPASAGTGVQGPSRVRSWHWLAGFGAALLIALFVYGPALSGPFLFDDVYLPFYLPGFAAQPLTDWLRGMRPVLMFTFWFSHRLSGLDPTAYHLFNILIHVLSALLVFAVTRRLAGMANIGSPQRNLLAIFGAGLFLLHPIQTESVAYIASRSEGLSGFFLLAAFCLFLHRAIPAISFASSLAVLVIFGVATLTKEHAVVLPAVLLLTDYYWNPGFSFAGIRRNWRLSLPMPAGAALGGAFVLRVLLMADTAGFGMKDLPWYQYFFTQCKVIWTYIRMTLLPFGQNADPDFPIARSFFEPGVLAALLG